MIHYIPLEELPAGLRIPEQFKDRFWYDEEKRCLAYDGVMYKLTFDKIQALHSSGNYRRAVEDLFRAAVPDDDRPSQGSHVLAVASGVVLAVALFAAGIVIWQRMQTDDMLPPAQPTITNDLVGN